MLRQFVPLACIEALREAAVRCFGRLEPGGDSRYGYSPFSSSARIEALLDFGAPSIAIEGMDELAREILGPAAYCNLQASWVRKRYAPGNAPALHRSNTWHQDGALGVQFGADRSEVPPMQELVTCWSR